MADSQSPPNPPQRNFKPRPGVYYRKTAEERAAAIQAEALRRENQIQPQSSQAGQDAVRRTGPIQRDPRSGYQNTGSVFSSAAGVTSSRAKSTHAVGGTEELVQRAEGGESVAGGEERRRKAKAGVGVEEKPVATTKHGPGRRTKATAKKDEINYVADEDAQGTHEGNPVDIEDIDRISISSDEDEEEEDDIMLSRRRRISKTPKPNLGLRPVRAARDLFARDNAENQAYTKARRKAKGKEQDKADPGHGDALDLGEEDVDLAVTPKQMTPIPEGKAILPSQSSTKRRRKSSTKDTHPQFETIEERAERERYTSELRKLSNELSTRIPDHPGKEEGSHATTLTSPQDGRLYLFQFPPLTPMLVNPSDQPEIKPEPTADSNAPTAASAPPAPRVKREDGAETKAQTTTPDSQKPKLLTAATHPALPAGLAGSLDVHQSGKVTLRWGGGGGADPTNLEVKWGSEVDFLQDVVLTSSRSGGNAGGSGDEGGKAWALRQVRNKFVVVPDWGKIYE